MANEKGGDFKQIGSTTETSLSVPAKNRIYAVRAVNFFGKESSMSSSVIYGNVTSEEEKKKKKKRRKRKKNKRRKKKNVRKKKKRKKRKSKRKKSKRKKKIKKMTKQAAEIQMILTVPIIATPMATKTKTTETVETIRRIKRIRKKTTTINTLPFRQQLFTEFHQFSGKQRYPLLAVFLLYKQLSLSLSSHSIFPKHLLL